MQIAEITPEIFNTMLVLAASVNNPKSETTTMYAEIQTDETHPQRLPLKRAIAARITNTNGKLRNKANVIWSPVFTSIVSALYSLTQDVNRLAIPATDNRLSVCPRTY